MEFLADILLIAGAFGAGTYCIVLARRLNRFNDLEKGVGGAIAVLSAQVDDMTKTLDAARKSTGASATSLGELTGRAEGVAQRLELLVASMHDLPDAKTYGAGQEDPAAGGGEVSKETGDPEVDLSRDASDGSDTQTAWDDDAAADQAFFKTTRRQGEVA